MQREKATWNIVESKQVNRTLKSVPKHVNIYIGICDIEVTEIFTDYILKEIGIKADKWKLLISSNSNSRTFKISLNLDDRVKLLPDNVWSENIICRKFYNPRKNRP